MSMLLTSKHSPNDPEVSPETRPPSRSVSGFTRPLFPTLCSSLSPPRTCPNPSFLLTPLLRRKFFSFTAEDFKNRTSTHSTTASTTSTSNSNTNSSNGERPCRVRTGPEAKNHSSTSSISSSSSSTPSSDDSMSIASIDNQLPTSVHSTSSTSSSTASGSTSLSMSTMSSSAETASRDSSLLSVENSPAKSPRVRYAQTFLLPWSDEWGQESYMYVTMVRSVM